LAKRVECEAVPVIPEILNRLSVPVVLRRVRL